MTNDGYLGQDILFRVSLIVYSPINNMRHENGVERWLIPIIKYQDINANIFF